MKLVVPAIGDLSGAGTVSPANDLDFKMTATVHTSGLLAMAGNTPIPVTVQGDVRGSGLPAGSGRRSPRKR